MKRESLLNGFYLLHAIIVWSGLAWQMRHIYIVRSAKDITLFWIICLLIAEVSALPLACSSRYRMWRLCHIVALILITILLVGVLRYG